MFEGDCVSVRVCVCVREREREIVCVLAHGGTRMQALMYISTQRTLAAGHFVFSYSCHNYLQSCHNIFFFNFAVLSKISIMRDIAIEPAAVRGCSYACAKRDNV